MKNRAGHLFRMAAFSLHGSLTPLRNYLRRMKAELGPEAATMAAAHKIVVIFYAMVKQQVEYDETLWDAREAQRRNGWGQNSNAKPNYCATNLFPSGLWPHNEPVRTRLFLGSLRFADNTPRIVAYSLMCCTVFSQKPSVPPPS